MIEKISTDEELEKALERFDELWSFRPGDCDFDERSKLVELIMEYEDRIHYGGVKT